MKFPGLTDALAELAKLLTSRILNRQSAMALLAQVTDRENLLCILSLHGVALKPRDQLQVQQFLADIFATELLGIVDRNEGGGAECRQPSGESGTDDRESVARSKLRVDTRRWLMEQFSPQLYGTGKSASSSRGGLLNAFRAKVYLPENGRN